jgi:hypothetical protein
MVSAASWQDRSASRPSRVRLACRMRHPGGDPVLAFSVPQDRFGLRRYSLEEFGLTKADLAPVYDEYLSAFDIELEES